MTSIDMTPTAEGYAGMARMFAEQLIADVKKNRMESDKRILKNFAEIVGYLAANEPDVYKRLLEVL